MYEMRKTRSSLLFRNGFVYHIDQQGPRIAELSDPKTIYIVDGQEAITCDAFTISIPLLQGDVVQVPEVTARAVSRVSGVHAS